MVGKKWQRLDPNVKKVWFISGFLIILIITVVLALILHFGVEPAVTNSLFISIGVGVLLLILLVIWIVMFYNRYMFQVQKDGIEIKRGILWKKDITIPYDRVQNVDIDRGPIEQLVGIYNLNVFTAGTSSETQAIFGAEGYLPGVKNAEKVRDTILERVQESEEDGLGGRKKKTLGTDAKILEEILKELRSIRKKME